MSEIFAWNNGSLCTAVGGDCSELLKVGTHDATVQLTVPDWMDINFNGILDKFFAGQYILNLYLVTDDVYEIILGCSIIEFELGDPNAEPTTPTPEPDPENNVVVETCSNSSSSLEVTSVLVSPYPIILHSYMAYDLLFNVNVTEKIPDDAIINVAIEGIMDDKIVPIPCLFTTPANATPVLDETCNFNLTEFYDFLFDGSSCDFLEDGCPELQEVGVHEGKFKMKVPYFIGNIIAIGNLDAFISGTYRIIVNVLDSEEEVLACTAITLELYKPPTTTTTTSATTTNEDLPSSAVSKYSRLVFVVFFIYLSKYF